MRNPSKEPKYLESIAKAILKLTKGKNRRVVSVKKVRRETGVGGSNRSAVQFYTNALRFLVREGVLEVINNSSPQKYKLIDEKKLKGFAEGQSSF